MASGAPSRPHPRPNMKSGVQAIWRTSDVLDHSAGTRTLPSPRMTLSNMPPRKRKVMAAPPKRMRANRVALACTAPLAPISPNSAGAASRTTAARGAIASSRSGSGRSAPGSVTGKACLLRRWLLQWAGGALQSIGLSLEDPLDDLATPVLSLALNRKRIEDWGVVMERPGMLARPRRRNGAREVTFSDAALALLCLIALAHSAFAAPPVCSAVGS